MRTHRCELPLNVPAHLLHNVWCYQAFADRPRDNSLSWTKHPSSLSSHILRDPLPTKCVCLLRISTAVNSIRFLRRARMCLVCVPSSRERHGEHLWSCDLVCPHIHDKVRNDARQTTLDVRCTARHDSPNPKSKVSAVREKTKSGGGSLKSAWIFGAGDCWPLSVNDVMDQQCCTVALQEAVTVWIHCRENLANGNTKKKRKKNFKAKNKK
ncbi:hypothetical protein EDB81DRAFT_364890 [Dactylonectria macrodidyma]|uniref:Uncharacterized protein n=1 Tax=Dactylonectria macrodidyma TaxID=307937 RepID=A0A9P9D2C0_9HYPO|nr:hypothetical protein EDB81DRAFT_364407 [Dactylonectria macrodidyma]KAH7111433.1 hypothetical protein EDB81DRAFT_364890 [Dactylonectria macrodidyma]